MKRITLSLCAAAVVALGVAAGSARADHHTLGYSGQQPWWNIFAHRPKCMTPEEQRLQHFWHDYYDAQKRYYKSLSHLDWVAYYKNHGMQIGGGGAGCGPMGGGGACRINYAPVAVNPGLQWMVPGAGCGTGGSPVMPVGGPMPGGQ